MRLNVAADQQAQTQLANELRKPAKYAYNAPRYEGGQRAANVAPGWRPKYVTDQPPPPPPASQNEALQQYINMNMTNRMNPGQQLNFPVFNRRGGAFGF